MIDERAVLWPESVGHGDNLVTFVGDYEGEPFYVLLPVRAAAEIGGDDVAVSVRPWT